MHNLLQHAVHELVKFSIFIVAVSNTKNCQVNYALQLGAGISERETSLCQHFRLLDLISGFLFEAFGGLESLEILTQ